MHLVRWVFLGLMAAGCAGEIDPNSILPQPDAGSVDPCIVETPALKSCQAAGCHTGTPLSANLDLGVASVTTNAKTLFLDKPNPGTMGVTMPGDPTGCPAGMYKLIDSANAMNSLLYTKTEVLGDMPTHPCGSKMPVIGTFTANDKACILKWIQSVIALK